jgi:class 3 adenylate cyclase/tetratricopeptide (TPR) repeat protein
MKCPKCQFENRESVKFCEKCGTKLELVCPNCGARIPLDREFCGECGTALREPKAAHPVDYSQPLSYVPKHLADKILTTRSSIEGERKVVTILFADTANYTSMSEKLDAEEVHQLMDGCFNILMDNIHKYEGTIDKFTGDGVMALFGAPVAHEDHAQRACYAALAMQIALLEYGEKVKKECGVDFKMRVGLNSGPVIVGSIGNDLRMDYTALGDTVNLASRMQTMAEPGAILVSQDTHKMARDFFKFKSLGKVQVKGKEEPVEAYELLEPTEVATRIEAAAARGLTKFVGRRREIESLKEAFEKARSGAGQVIGIVGEAGVGKSRLLLEVRRALPIEQYTYIEGHCLHYGGSMAYLPLLDIMRSCFGIKEGEREFLIKKKMTEKIAHFDEKLKAVLTPLQEILSLKVEDAEYLKLEPQKKRERTFEAIRDLLIRESQARPLILAVEDLQWIDKTSEEFLNYFIGWLASSHILLVLLYRPEYTHLWGSRSYYSQIKVEQLPISASAELVQSILEGGEVVPELKELILTRAAGNPLFMEEFTRTLVENGSIRKEDHKYVLSTKASEIQVPDTIHGIIAARMDRLEENLKRTMQVASVIGRDFAYRILYSITGMQDELKSYLVNLQGLEFIYEKSLFPELEYVFRHALTQEVAYNSLLLKRRKEIHERIGKAIEELYHDRLEEFYEMLAYHYSRSDNLEKAYEYLVLAGIKAGYGYSLWEAYRFCKEAIQVLNRGPQTEENKRKGIEIRLLMAQVMIALGFPVDWVQVLEEGVKLASDLADVGSVARFYSQIGRGYEILGDPAMGIEYGEKALEQAEKIGDVALVAPIVFNLCSTYFVTADYLKIVELSEKAIALIEKTGTQAESFDQPFNMYAVLLSMSGYARGFLGDFETGQDMCERGLSLAEESGKLYSLALGKLYFGFFFEVRGDGENAIKHLQESARLLEQTQAIYMIGVICGGLAYGHYYLGDVENARKQAERGIELHNRVGSHLWLSVSYLVLGMIYLDSGDLKKARSCIEQALNLAHKNSEKQHEELSKISLGRILGKEDISQCDKAEKYILQGIKILEEREIAPYSSRGYLYLGELYADIGRKEKALETLKKAESAFRKMGMDYWLRRTQEVMAKVHG